MVATFRNSLANLPASSQHRLSDNGVRDDGQDDGEDIESLLEELPMPRPSATSLSDNFDIIPDNKTELVTVTSSQRVIETYEQIVTALQKTTFKYDQLASNISSISGRLQVLEQKQEEIIGRMSDQQGRYQRPIDRIKNESKDESNDLERTSFAERPCSIIEHAGRAEEETASAVVASETAPTCFLLELYPRPGNGYSGRIHHTLTKQSASFKGPNLEQTLPFIKKYLPQLAESGVSNEPIETTPAPERPVKPSEQITSSMEKPPRQMPAPECSCIKEIGLIQDRQKTIQPPFRLQARKQFAVVLNLELPISQEDSLKSNYMLRYDVDFKARHLPDNRIANQSTQHGGMNSKFPKDARAFYLDALPPGKFALDIRLVVPQKNISEQMQREIYVL